MLAKRVSKEHTHLMNRAVPIDKIKDFESTAVDLMDLLQRKDNTDIVKEFPATVAQYTGDKNKVTTNLETTQQYYEIGKREQFIIFAGKRAVGLSTVINNVDTPSGVDPSWPNLSGFICHPFRGQGLGRLSLETRMQVVRHHFGNHAWTLVRRGNIRSEHLVVSVGFKKSKEVISGWGDRDLYTFNADNIS